MALEDGGMNKGPTTMSTQTGPLKGVELVSGIELNLDEARDELVELRPQERLGWALENFGSGFALTTSFGIQSAVLLHMLNGLAGGHDVSVIWVDTGYLPPETYLYADELTTLLELDLRVAQSPLSPARMEALHGRLWETGSVKDLETYHRIRKVEPLERSLIDSQVRCWASGVRRDQTDHRRSMTCLDPIRGRLSLRPLLDWTPKDVFYYMQENQLPQHPLFEKGYSTVGDWHSSAPDGGVSSGRDTRFGGLKQECGLHLPDVMGEGLMGEGI